MKFSPRLLFSLACGLAILGRPAPAADAATAALPYVAAPAFAGLSFAQPLAIVTPPGETNRLFVIEKTGRIVVVPDLTRPSREIFLDLSDRLGTNTDGELGVLALAFHPDYRTNGQFYVWYTQFTGSGRTAHGTSRLARFKVDANNPNRADPASEQLLIVQADEASNHNGGELLFGPDGYLYLSIGDEGAYNDIFENSQRIDRDFFSGILRIDVDRRPGNLEPNAHPAVQPGTYSVPRDNPFVGATEFNGRPVEPSAVRTEFWAVGLRNVWRMAFDSETGRLWAADVGQKASEEVNLIVRGGNYGWNYREGRERGPRRAPAELSFLEPVWEYPRSEGFSITGGFVYRGTQHPALAGQYVFGDFVSGRVWALRPDEDRPVSADRVRQIAQVPAIASFGLDPRTGDILVASLTDGIVRLKPVAATAATTSYFPPPDTEGGWRRLTEPDAVGRETGFDVAKLDDVFAFIQGSTRNGGLLVLRHGWLVYERYFGLGHREATPNLASCGKSFTSIAVGMLLAERPELFPDGLDQKVFTPRYFPAEAFPLSDPRMSGIKLGHLLAFSAGIRGNTPARVQGEPVTLDPMGPDGWPAMVDAIALGKKDGRDAGGKPFSTATLWCEPGGGYSYASASIHLASMLLRQVTGIELQDYLRSRLAEPLGWGRWGWGYRHAAEVTHTPGAGGIALRATDMLRFGYLLLRDGRWGDRQLTPAEYVQHCRRASPYNPHWPYSLQFDVNTGGQLPDVPRDGFWKSGSGGHVLYVVPSLDLVVWKLGGRDGQYSSTDTGLPTHPEAALEARPRVNWKESVDAETAKRQTLQRIVAALGPEAGGPLVEGATRPEQAR